MAAFKTKKIISGETVGWKLRKARRKLKLTVEQAEEETKVRAKYLKAIEADDWKAFPSRIYVLGFVRRYSEFLGLSSKEVLAEFKDQFDNFTVSKGLETLSKRKTEKPSVIITPRLIYATLAILAVVFVIGYMIFAISKFSKPPEIEITFPKTEVVTDRDIVIEGQTSPNAIIEINSQAANVEDSGHFIQKVRLEPGINVFEIKAKSRLGKEKTKIIRVLYQTNALPAPSATVSAS